MADGGLDRIDYMRSLASRLTATDHGARGALIAQAAGFLGVSKQTVFSRLRAVGWDSGRKLRTDKGDSAVAREEVIAVAAILSSSRRANGKQLLSVEDAIDIAVANDRLRTAVSPTTMLRLMRQNHCHPDMLNAASPHVNMRSLHPNHVWQLDASICVLYYLRNGQVGVMDQRKFNERKPRDLAKIINERVLRYAVTDHTSGALYARYYQTAGEDQATLFDFLMAAFQQREEGLMHGVPLMLVWDAGSANQAHGIRNLLTALAIRHWAHVPGNPRAKGQVESIHNVIERRFEGRLAFTRIESVEQLNGHLDTWLRDFNGNVKHSRHGHTRWGVWQTIRQEHLRLCPPATLCRELLFAKPVTRTVKGNLTVQYTFKGFDAAFYSVADVPTVRVGDEVTVTFNPYRAPNVFVISLDEEGATRYYECTPIARDASGFAICDPVFGESYKAPRDTVADAARKEINDLAYGQRDTLDAASARTKGRLAFDGQINPFKDVEERATQVPAFIQRRGTELHVPNPAQVELKPLSHVQALFELRARLGRAIAREEAALVADRFPDGVPETEFDALVELITNPTAAAPEPEFPRLVAVK